MMVLVIPESCIQSKESKDYMLDKKYIAWQDPYLQENIFQQIRD